MRYLSVLIFFTFSALAQAESAIAQAESAFAQAESAIKQAESSITFRNDVTMNAHTYLINLATDKQTLPDSLNHMDIVKDAVDAYRKEVSVKRFHFIRSRNNQVSGITNQLLQTGSLPADSCESLCEKLSKFIPLYKNAVWPEVKAYNQQWIAEAKQLIDQYGNAMEAQIDKLLITPLIPTRHTIYVIENIDRGASTSGREPVSVMSSRNPQYQGLFVLEMIYHEIAHTWSTGRNSRLQTGLKEVFDNSQTQVPRSLWHVIHFYTVGHVTRELLKADGIQYTPYAETNGVYGGRWAVLLPPVEKHWTEYLEGRTSMDEALNAIHQHFSSL